MAHSLIAHRAASGACWERKRPGWGARRVALERADTARHLRVALDVAFVLEGGQALLDGELAWLPSLRRWARSLSPRRTLGCARAFRSASSGGGRLHDRTSRDPSPFIGPTIYFLDQTGRAVVTDLEFALDGGDRSAARLADEANGLLQQRVVTGPVGPGDMEGRGDTVAQPQRLGYVDAGARRWFGLIVRTVDSLRGLFAAQGLQQLRYELAEGGYHQDEAGVGLCELVGILTCVVQCPLQQQVVEAEAADHQALVEYEGEVFLSGESELGDAFT